MDQQTIDRPYSILPYAVGMALGLQCGLCLFNPLTKRVVKRRTYKILGPTPQPYITTNTHTHIHTPENQASFSPGALAEPIRTLTGSSGLQKEIVVAMPCDRESWQPIQTILEFLLINHKLEAILKQHALSLSVCNRPTA